MKHGLCYLEHGWIFLLVGIFCTICCPSPSTATAPHVLSNIQVIYQDDRWHVVLTGAESMTYKASKTVDPLRQTVDLPNTVISPEALPRHKENEIVGRITASISISGPQPLTQIEIDLNRDTSYEISRAQEKIWVSFDTSALLTRAEPLQIEPVAE